MTSTLGDVTVTFVKIESGQYALQVDGRLGAEDFQRWKRIVKGAGCRWNPEDKIWLCPDPGLDAEPFFLLVRGFVSMGIHVEGPGMSRLCKVIAQAANIPPVDKWSEDASSWPAMKLAGDLVSEWDQANQEPEPARQMVKESSVSDRSQDERVGLIADILEKSGGSILLAELETKSTPELWLLLQEVWSAAETGAAKAKGRDKPEYVSV